MPNYSDTKVNDMIFNVLDSATYNTLSSQNQLVNNQLYFVTNDGGTSITSSTGTSALTLGFGSKYQLTAGGYSCIFTMPSIPVATYNVLGGLKPWKTYTTSATGVTAATAATTITVNAISNTSGKYYAVEADKDGRLFVNVPWTNVNSSYAASGHTHPLSITTNTGTATVSLEHGSKYQLTAGGNSLIFQMPAAQDLSGYALLSGANFTGPVSFGDSVTMDEATVGDLVVTGAASFTNNIQANTINGVTVGSSPKFTDTNTEVSTFTLNTSTGTSQVSLASAGKYVLTAGSKSIIFTMPTIPTVPSNIVNTITTTAGAHTAITSQKGNVSFNVPTTAAHVGIKFGYTTSGNNRAVQQDSNGNLYVVQKDDNTNTDTLVTQTATTTNANYEILFSATADNTTRTEGARKTSALTYNPSTNQLTNLGRITGHGISSTTSDNDGDYQTSISQNYSAINFTSSGEGSSSTHQSSIGVGSAAASLQTTYYDEDTDKTYTSAIRIYKNLIRLYGPDNYDFINIDTDTKAVSIHDVVTPTSNNDAANKKYVDDSVATKIGGSGTSGYLAKFNGTRSVTNGPQLGSSTTTYLRNDGTWATPSDTNTWRKVQLNGTDKLGTGISTNPLNLKAGTNVSITESNGTFTFSATDTTYTLSGLGGVGTVSASGTAPLTLSASKSGTTVTISGSVADASATAKGVVTTGTQSFKGDKTFQSDTFRLRNANNDNNQAGSNPWITQLNLGDGNYVTVTEYKDDHMAIRGSSIVLNTDSAYSVYSATQTYSVGNIVWYDKAYYRCTTAITTAEAWTAGHWTAMPTSGIMANANLNPWKDNTYSLGTSSYRWSDVRTVKLNGTEVPSSPKFTDTVYTHPTYTSRSSGLYKITVDGTGHVSNVASVAKSDITGLGIPAQDTVYTHPTYTSKSSGLYKITVDGTGHVSGTATVAKSDITALGIPAQDTVYTHPTYTSKSSGLYKITVDGTGHVSGTASVAKADITGLGIPAQDTVTTVTASGTGNVVTGMSASNGAITYTMGTVSTTAAQIIRW